jgi:hypothetical protein
MLKFLELKEYISSLPKIKRMTVINAINEFRSERGENSIEDVSSLKSPILVLVDLDTEISEKYLKSLFKYIEKISATKDRYEIMSSDFKSIYINFSKGEILYDCDNIVPFQKYNFLWGFLKKLLKNNKMYPAEGYLFSSKWRKRKNNPYNHHELIKPAFSKLKNIIEEYNLPLIIERNDKNIIYELTKCDWNILSSDITESMEYFEKSKTELKKDINKSLEYLIRAISIYPEEWKYYAKYIELFLQKKIEIPHSDILRKALEVLEAEKSKYIVSIECLKKYTEQVKNYLSTDEEIINEWQGILSNIKKYIEKLMSIRKSVLELNKDEVEFLKIKDFF